MLSLPRFRCWKCKKKSIYTCPSCQTCSCSLECCVLHKEVADCDGEFSDHVDMKDYTTANLKSDVQKIACLTEKTQSSLKMLKRLAPYKAYTKTQKLLYKAYDERSSRVVFLPNQSQKASQNLSTPETIFCELLDGRTAMRSALRWDDPAGRILADFNAQYSASYTEMFLKLDGCKFNALEVDLQENLSGLLADVVVYEYPVFTVTRPLKTAGKRDLYDEWLDEWEWRME
ncbi:hypothetical protein SS50377_22964 [Spironucleus salmonicida]|uniref:HIT-type domain-containing protein n=1 Tax=Spironucleus salmonicida TaxID=348837 RepID=V6LTR9_9EUKA|nr:hypothetical protein SS50377_22964 [Spironucleus salmonicida]|eukprot:EST47990.1 hypothetical protein SS50377_11908 [Spironucleus salmonicida]